MIAANRALLGLLNVHSTWVELPEAYKKDADTEKQDWTEAINKITKDSRDQVILDQCLDSVMTLFVYSRY